MPSTVSQEGRYRAVPTSWLLTESTKTESVGVQIHYTCTHILDEQKDEFVALEMPFPTAEGTVWIVKKDGTANERGVKDLCRVLKWSGDLTEIVEQRRWKPPVCDIDVTAEVYNGKTRFKASWLHEPGSRGNGREIARRLMSAHSETFRRIAAELPNPAGSDIQQVANTILPDAGQVAPIDLSPAPEGEVPF